MKNKKNILKEAGVLFIVAILVLTTIGIVTTTMAQTNPGNVGVKSIDLPVDGFAGEYVPVQVTVKDYGSSTETTDVQVEIIKLPGGTPEYAELVEDVTIPKDGEKVITFPDWTPTDWGSPNYECQPVTYQVTAFTILEGDTDPGNDEKTKAITLTLDSIPPVIKIFKSRPILPVGPCFGIWNRGRAKDDCSGLDRVEWFENTNPLPPPTTTFTPWGGFWRMRWGGLCSDIITIRVYDKAGNWI